MSSSPYIAGTEKDEILTENSSQFQRVREIVRYHFDLEILHKWREIRMIEAEIERGRRLRILLEKLIMNEMVYGGGSETLILPTGPSADGDVVGTQPDESAYSRYFGISMGRRSTRYAGQNIAFRNAEMLGGGRLQNEPQAQFEMRSDGTIVRMRCPKCGADRFRSMLGFLNHCRIHCRLVFSSQDERLQRCGVVIDPTEVPLDYFTKHPSQLKQEMDLALIRADVLGPQQDQQRRPQITEYPNDLAGSLGDSAVDCPAVIDPIAAESRFYIKKSIIVGNAAKSLLASGSLGKRKAEDESIRETSINSMDEKIPSHKWRIYICAVKAARGKDENSVEKYIRGVRFILHPSYRPNDVQDVLEPPFELVRTGWGEFPVRIQIHFVDPERNKPREIVHLVRIRTAVSGKYITAAEQAYELELDRCTNLTLAPPLPERIKSSGYDSPGAADDDLLTMIVADFSLVGKRGRRAFESQYKPSASLEDLFRLDLKSQMALELKRAIAMCEYLSQHFPTFSQTPEQVVQWCRSKGFTPAAVSSIFAAIEVSSPLEPEQLQYCRFCGLAHVPQDKFDILQKNCSFRPRKIHVSSRTPSTELMESCDLLSETNEAFKKVKQDYFGPAFLILDDVGAASSSSFIPRDRSDDLLTDWTETLISQLYLPHFQRSSADERRHSSRLISLGMRAFLHAFVRHSIEQIPSSKERTPDRPTLLTALHLYRAATTQEPYDFLTAAFMAGTKPGPSSQQSP